MKALSQLSRERRDFGDLTESCWTMIKSNNIEDLLGHQRNQIMDRLESIEMRLKKINRKSKVIGLILESLLDRTTNKGLEIYSEFLRSSKNWVKP